MNKNFKYSQTLLKLTNGPMHMKDCIEQKKYIQIFMYFPLTNSLSKLLSPKKKKLTLIESEFSHVFKSIMALNLFFLIKYYSL